MYECVFPSISLYTLPLLIPFVSSVIPSQLNDLSLSLSKQPHHMNLSVV